MRLVDRVLAIEPDGGRYGLGLIRAEADIRPDDWFMTCHFVDDQVMPGTLMFECCLHTLRIFLMRMGWIGETGEVVCHPVPGVASRLKCRGQVVASTAKVTYEVEIKELGFRPEPYAIVDALMYADGKPIVEITAMSLRMVGLDRDKLDAIWAGRRATPPRRLYDAASIRAFAVGKPSEAFGAPYRVFDHDRVIARLPGPPYQFLDRVIETGGRPLGDGPRGQGRRRVRRPARRLVLRRRPRRPDAVRRPARSGPATVRLAGGLHGLGPDERRRPVVPEPRRVGHAVRGDRPADWNLADRGDDDQGLEVGRDDHPELRHRDDRRWPSRVPGGDDVRLLLEGGPEQPGRHPRRGPVPARRPPSWLGRPASTSRPMRRSPTTAGG